MTKRSTRQVDVACHELAHALVRHDRQDEDPELDYAAEELVAESVAHQAVSFVGLDSSASAVATSPCEARARRPTRSSASRASSTGLARRLEQALGAEDTEATVIATAA